MEELDINKMTEIETCGFERRLRNRIKKIYEIVDWKETFNKTVNFFTVNAINTLPDTIRRECGPEPEPEADLFSNGCGGGALVF